MENKNTSEKQIKHIKDIKNPEDRKRIYKEARNGKKTGVKQIDALAKNLIPLNERSPEEAAAIRRKGAEAVNKLKGERKTAKEILNNILPLYANNNAIKNNDNIPEDIKNIILSKNINVTQYDLLYMAMLKQAQEGNYQAATFIRDTNGEKPINENHNINEGMSEADKQLIENLKNRLNIVDTD